MSTFRERLEAAFKADLGDRPQAWTSHGVEGNTFMAGAKAALLIAADQVVQTRAIDAGNVTLTYQERIRLAIGEDLRALAREMEGT
jgi:hypothetical protein